MSGIGIANLPNQRHRRAAKKGAHLTLLVVGESGLGKTTFINTLFTTTLLTHKEKKKPEKGEKSESTTKIKISEAELEEKGFKLKLSIVDTPGFGDFVNNTDCWVQVVDFIEKQYLNYLNQEMQPDRSNMEDTRIHTCLYFIEPTGHSLKTLDILAMKEIGSRANLVPIIAKSDTLTQSDLKGFKDRIREDIAAHEIQIYNPPLESEDEQTTTRNKEIAAAIPFAIIGSEELISVGDKKERGRQYLWGSCQVENDDHCDFKKLRSLLLRSHLLDIISSMESHYENFRDKQLEKGGLTSEMTPEKRQKDFQAKVQKQEDQMRKKFTEQVKQEEARFRSWEERISADGEKFNAEIEKKKEELNSLKEEVSGLMAKLNATQPKKK